MPLFVLVHEPANRFDLLSLSFLRVLGPCQEAVAAQLRIHDGLVLVGLLRQKVPGAPG